MKFPEKYRIKTGVLASDTGKNGSFLIPYGKIFLQVIASINYMGWDHVSVSTQFRCPFWEEMCFVKELFWNENDWVIQYHPAKDNYVNNHPYCLHLWKCLYEKIPVPPSILVGIK